jgi:acetylornithine deacetylase
VPTNANIAAAINAVDRLFPEYVELLQELVRQPSVLGQVYSAQGIIFRHLRQLGLDAQMAEIELESVINDEYFAPGRWSTNGQPNVWATMAPIGSGGRSLVLNGHIDVVPPGPDECWRYPPWGGTIVGDRLYGRGAMDMKGGLVAALLAMDALRDAGSALRGSVIFESVIEEECTGNGMLAQRRRTGPVDGAIILEPTGSTTWLATPGVAWFDVEVSGQAAYVGQGATSVNAIDMAIDLIQRFKPVMVAELNAAFDHPAFSAMTNPLTLNVGRIEGGDWPSSVPLQCRFTCRVAYPIGWSFADARQFVERHVADAARSNPWLAQHPPRIRFSGFRATGWEYRADPTLLNLVETWHYREAGSALEGIGWPGTADARYFASSEPVVYYGPGGETFMVPMSMLI